MESKVPPEDTLSEWHDRPMRVRHFLNVGTRLAVGPNFAFSAGTTEALSDAQRQNVASILELLPVEDDPTAPDG